MPYVKSQEVIEEVLTRLTDAGMCAAEQRGDQGMVIEEQFEFPVALLTCPPWSQRRKQDLF